MLVKDFEWKTENRCHNEDSLFIAHAKTGTFTVLDRLTGWGEGDVRDIESGYRDNKGKLWLVSGMFDIREFPELTEEEAANRIKLEANTCIGWFANAIMSGYDYAKKETKENVQEC